MDRTLTALFWLCLLVITYAYLGYPLAISLLAKLSHCRPGTFCVRPKSISFVVAAREGGLRVRERVIELQQQLARAGVSGEIILILDGAQDALINGAEFDDTHTVRVVPLIQNVGKSAAISKGVEIATGEIVAFADVRQRWAEDALVRLLNRFEDSRVGAVSGDLELEAGGANQGVSFYWRYEKWIRIQEGTFDSVVGVTGAIAAVRRSLFSAIPAGTVLDDVYWPLQVVMAGYRVVHEPTAKAYDRLPDELAGEFRRKVRTLAGNFQLIIRLPAALIPWRNRVWWQLISRKLLRLAVPWAFLVALVVSAALPGPLYKTLFWLQIVAYSGLLLAWALPTARRGRLGAAAVSFAMLNFAAWVAFWVWLSGGTSRSWNPTRYTDTSESQPSVAGNI
jgi:biofilm PGA synthesis N-glycosyltransferase PgaC